MILSHGRSVSFVTIPLGSNFELIPLWHVAPIRSDSRGSMGRLIAHATFALIIRTKSLAVSLFALRLHRDWTLCPISKFPASD